MQSQCPNDLELTAALLGPQGLRRAFPLVAFDRPRMTLSDWIGEGLRASEWRARRRPSRVAEAAETGVGDQPAPASRPNSTFEREPVDRLLAFAAAGRPLPRCGVIGLAAQQGCLVAVFGYHVLRDTDGGRFLVIRGPSKAALIGGGLVSDQVQSTIERLAGSMGCCRTILRRW